MNQSKFTGKSFCLTAQIEKDLIPIDWSKVNSFSTFSKEKYKLQKIDFFTTHYKNKEELFSSLLKSDVVSKEQLKYMRLFIYQIKQEYKTEVIDGDEKKIFSPIYNKEPLPFDLIYSDYKKLLESDFAVISYLKNLVNDFEFIKYLISFYSENGIYNNKALKKIKHSISYHENEIINSGDEKFISKTLHTINGLKRKERKILESKSLLESVYNYSYDLNKGNIVGKEEIESATNNLIEFFLREKYYVIGCKDGINDKRELMYEYDKLSKIKINYLDFHTFVALIQNYVSKPVKNSEFEPQIHYSKPKNKTYEIPGQLTLY